MHKDRPRTSILAHPLNLLLIGSGALSATWVGDWRPLVVVAAAELLWLVGGPIAARRRRKAALEHQDHESQQSLVRKLDENGRRRFLELDRVRLDVRRLAEANPTLTAVGVERELARVDELVDGWLRMAARAAEHRAILDERDGPRGGDFEAMEAVARMEAELEEVERALLSVRDDVLEMSAPEPLAARLDALGQGMRAVERSAAAVRALDRGTVSSRR